MEWFEPLGIKLVGVYRTEVNIEFVLEEFKYVFSEDLGSYKSPAISLPIDPKFPPISFKARNFPLTMRKKVDVAIDKLLDQGQIWIPGTVIEKTGPLSYKTVTPDGKSIRCHIDQMRNRKTPLASPQSSPGTQVNSTIPASSSAIPSSSNIPIQPSDPTAETETP
ncbi:hypothetical protein AVEN_178140-1 [Araneus ventricosus]|uniref:Uncharacterized protein n=1 Tax=Araneus ventricosus TaxID=182803 RepID=A0A4Y2GB09_ARAVE|nr:hypothetical protein AVEN_178140-1 [Araneus ventricosus]